MEFISYKAPQNSLTAGRVLQHSKQVLDMLFRKHAPMIFKIGFTHNPIWRWTNDIYGYAFAVERWTNMVVLYETQEPFSPAMLEAALIDLYKCYSLASFCRVPTAQSNIVLYDPCPRLLTCVKLLWPLPIFQASLVAKTSEPAGTARSRQHM